MSDPGSVAAQIGAVFAAPSLALLAPTMVSAFLLGLGGTAHCAGMCGGILTTLARRGAQPVRFARTLAVQSEHGAPIAFATLGSATAPAEPKPLALQLAYNLGRITSYSVAGAIAGAAGSAAWFASSVLPVQQTAFVIASLMMILIGLHLAGVPVLAHWLERVGARAWQLIEPVARTSLRRTGVGGALMAGAAWGWVPCGMVYGMLTAALVSGGALPGAAIALAFGFGTLPGLTTLGWAAQRGFARPQSVRLFRIAGILIAAWGVAGLLRIDPIAHLHQIGEACVSWLR